MVLPVFAIIIIGTTVQASYNGDRYEPELVAMEAPLSHLDFDIRNGAAFRFHLNNFGFGVGGEYRRVLGRNTKGVFEFQIGNVKDESEQSFRDYWGVSTIPNKYNRIIAFPAMLGVKQRLFSERLSDNFRLFVQASGGPSPAYVYPYYDHDRFGYGFRITHEMVGFTVDPNYDPFEGWGEGEFVLGAAGHLSIGANIGGDFGNIQTISIGYFFHYYPDGIQVMEPNRPGPGFVVGEDPANMPSTAIQPANSRQSFFGTPHITFVFGTMW